MGREEDGSLVGSGGLSSDKTLWIPKKQVRVHRLPAGPVIPYLLLPRTAYCAKLLKRNGARQ